MKIKMPLVLKNYLSYLSSIRGNTKDTIIAYRYDLIFFFRYLKIYYNLVDDNTPFECISISDIDIPFIKNIDLMEIYSFLTYLEMDRNNNSATRARKIAAIKSFFGYANKKAKFLDYDISTELETPKIRKKVPMFLTYGECVKLINSVSGTHLLRDKCIIIIFLNTGIRLSELCSINISSIKNNTLIVTGKGNKQRLIYLNDYCMNSINSFLKERLAVKNIINEDAKDALFISQKRNRINKRTVEDVVKNTIEKAGLSKKYSVHKLRHTAATLLFQSGIDIRTLQIILGHESVSTTQIYTHVNEEQIKEAMNVNPLNKI